MLFSRYFNAKLFVIFQVFLYIYNKQVVSCLVAESITEANRLLPGHAALCTNETFPATCGITRIWTAKQHRHKGYAAKLMNALRYAGETQWENKAKRVHLSYSSTSCCTV
jgi:GNAT superfamily N-acetyltransferase